LIDIAYIHSKAGRQADRQTGRQTGRQDSQGQDRKKPIGKEVFQNTTMYNNQDMPPRVYLPTEHQKTK